MLFPILISLRYKKRKKNFNVDKIELRIIKKHNYIYNASFNN
jgi:hypothetical protein